MRDSNNVYGFAPDVTDEGTMKNVVAPDGTAGNEEALTTEETFAYVPIIDNICQLQWELLNCSEILQIAQAYYYFSILFRENLETAIRLFPDDPNLERLRREECNTDNLFPWPQIVGTGEKLDHDEFVRRLLALQPIDNTQKILSAGAEYLKLVRGVGPISKALSFVSYEDGGLFEVLLSILRAPDWCIEGQKYFKYFLEHHLLFDSDPSEGQGALCRHFKPDDRIIPLWKAFKEILVISAPRLSALVYAAR